MDNSLNRRDFLIAAGAIAAAATFRQAMAQTTAAGAAASQPALDAFNRPMRWGQLVLVETDPGTYDPAFWLDLYRRMHVDGVCLSAGGCICYYPTKIPFHYKSSAMKEGTDPLGDLVKACRGMGMSVIARTDPHSVRDDAASAHPEWIAVDAAGNKRRHWAAPNRWVTCALGPYNFQFMTEVHKEIATSYAIDGIFANRWQGSGMCYCDSCRQLFRAFANLDLPRGTNVTDPAFRKYLEWNQARLFELWHLWDNEMQKIRAGCRYIPNSGGGSTSPLDMHEIGAIAPLLAADRQSRRGIMAPWASGKNAKEFRATLGNKPILGISALGIDDDHRWKDSVLNGPELRIWLADGMANGLRPWVAKFGGVVYDKRWIPVVEKFYDWHFRNDKYLRNTRSLARVAMVYSQQTGTYYGANAKARRVEDHELGLYQALIEARIPFEMAHDQNLDAAHIDQFKLLLLPNIAALSSKQCEQLRQYVARGGSLLATFETSLYDERGSRRADFGLADVFGVSYAGAVQTDVKNSYMHIEAQTNHPVLRGLEDAGRIINTVQHVDVRATAAFANPPLTRIPTYPDLPMEEVYPRTLRTDVPEVYLRQMGVSRVAYIPGDLDRTFWEILAADHALLLRNLVEWTLNEEPSVSVTGPGLLEVTAWEQANSMAIHLVNLTNPMMLKASYREFIEIGPQTVALRLPADKKIKNIRLLSAGSTVPVQLPTNVISFKTGAITDFEVIAIDF